MQYGYFACVLPSINYDHTVLIKSDLAIMILALVMLFKSYIAGNMLPVTIYH